MIGKMIYLLCTLELGKILSQPLGPLAMESSRIPQHLPSWSFSMCGETWPVYSSSRVNSQTPLRRVICLSPFNSNGKGKPEGILCFNFGGFVLLWGHAWQCLGFTPVSALSDQPRQKTIWVPEMGPWSAVCKVNK